MNRILIAIGTLIGRGWARMACAIDDHDWEFLSERYHFDNSRGRRRPYLRVQVDRCGRPHCSATRSRRFKVTHR